jgi:hypothetical protein
VVLKFKNHLTQGHRVKTCDNDLLLPDGTEGVMPHPHGWFDCLKICCLVYGSIHLAVMIKQH